MSQEQTPKEQPQPKFELPSPVEQYEYHLRQLAALKYPDEERTAELETSIAKAIQRKVGDFVQEQQHRERVRLYENSLRRQLAEKHPNLTPDEAQRYERRINELVDDFRKNQAQQQQQQEADGSAAAASATNCPGRS